MNRNRGTPSIVSSIKVAHMTLIRRSKRHKCFHSSTTSLGLVVAILFIVFIHKFSGTKAMEI